MIGSGRPHGIDPAQLVGAPHRLPKSVAVYKAQSRMRTNLPSVEEGGAARNSARSRREHSFLGPRLNHPVRKADLENAADALIQFILDQPPLAIGLQTAAEPVMLWPGGRALSDQPAQQNRRCRLSLVEVLLSKVCTRGNPIFQREPEPQSSCSPCYPYPAKAGCPTVAGGRWTRAAPAGMAPAVSWS